MASYSVTRSAGGNVFGLYHGRLRHRAQETFDRAREDGLVTFTEHGTDEPRKIVAQKGTVVFGDSGRCPCECRAHGKTSCGCPCPRHPYTTGMK